MADWWASYIRRRASRYGVDPQAALRVAGSEGLSGGVGDQGTSFGPFQLHEGGALPRGRGRAWAESPAGIDYALRAMASAGARGLRGQAAIEAIVRNFERPADPEGEIARASGGASGGAPASAPAPTASDSGDPRGDFTKALISSVGKHDPAASVQALTDLVRKRSLSQFAGPAAGAAGGAVTQGGVQGGAGDPAVEELIYDPLGSIFDGTRSSKPYGGHTDHVHVADDNPQAMLAAIRQAEAMGLHVGENPYTGKVNPVHTGNSFHYRRFAGRFNGRQLGEAADVSGDPRKMAAYYRWVAQHYG